MTRAARAGGLRSALAALVLAASASAQHRTSAEFEAPDGSPSLGVDIAAFSAGVRPGGCGWVTLTVANPAKAPARKVELRAEEVSGGSFYSRASVEVEPGSRRTVILPTAAMGRLRVSVDGTPWGEAGSRSTWGSPPGRPTLAILGTPRSMPVLASDVVRLSAEDLPDRWWLMSGFDAVVLGEGAGGARLGPERQRLLADYLAGGGKILLDGVDVAAMPEGPLRDVLSPGGDGRFGLGRFEPMTEMNWRTFLSSGLSRAMSGAPVDDLLTTLPIRDLEDEIPVGAIMTMLVLFSIAVSVQAFLLLRSRRGALLIFTIPVTGLGFAGAVLLYGLFGQGLGTKGSIRSFTVLDQRSHRAAAIAQRGVFSGLSRGSVPVGEDTLVSKGRGGFGLTMTGGVTADGLIDAREVIGVTTVTVGQARERLRFRRQADGKLQCISDGAFAPVAGRNMIIVRDFDGSSYVSFGDGLLGKRPDAGADTIRSIYRGFGAGRAGNVPGSSAWICEQAPSELPPGSYLAIVESTPWVPSLGLEVRWIDSDHVVFGMLAEADIDG